MAATYTLISSVTVGSGGAANIEFTSIPATYTDLLVKVSLRLNTTAQPQGWQDMTLQFNGSSTTYTGKRVLGTGSATGSSSDEYYYFANNLNSTSDTFNNAEIYIPNYTSSNQKSFSVDSVQENNGTAALALLSAGLFNGTAVITSIKLLNNTGSYNLVQHSTAYLYGISNA